MKNLTIIAAIGKNYELGLNNDLIWKLKKDMTFFRENTMNKEMLMGRKTLESLPSMLEGRRHLVLTRKKIDNPNIICFNSVENFLEYAKDKDEIMIIGGESIYKTFIDYSDKLLLTEIEDEHEADSYFPYFDKSNFTREIIKEDEESNIKFKHVLYKRK